MGLFKKIKKAVKKVVKAPFKLAKKVIQAPFKIAGSLFGGRGHFQYAHNGYGGSCNGCSPYGGPPIGMDLCGPGFMMPPMSFSPPCAPVCSPNFSPVTVSSSMRLSVGFNI